MEYQTTLFPILAYTSNSGQLGHRIMRFLNLVAISKSFGINDIYPPFAVYLKYFKAGLNSECLYYFPNQASDVQEHLKSHLTKFLLSAGPQGAQRAAVLQARLPAKRELFELIDREHPALDDEAEQSLFISDHWQFFTAKVKEDPSQSTSCKMIDSALVPEGDFDRIQSPSFLQNASLLLMDFADFYCSSIDPEGDLALARRLFAPTDRYAERIARRAHMMRSDCDVVVGVHIRWGDFREWQDGRYFFPIEEYLRLMREALEHFSGKKVLFLVACNEALSADVFKPFDVVMAPGHIIDDLYLLAECDCTIGTTSGYHWWAANYRGIPSFSLTERGQRLVFL